MSHDRWLLRPRAAARPRVRLFCLPHAGAGASVFFPWSRELPEDVDVCAVQLPGRESRFGEAPLRRMAPLADGIADAILRHVDGPYAIFGHSMGATVGFEVVRALRRRGAPAPLRLIVAGRRAPHLPTPTPLRYPLPRPEFIAEMQRLGGTPPAILAEPELLDLFMGVLRADFEVLETHAFAPEAPLPTPITIFHGERDAEVSLAEIEAWAQHTSGGQRLHVFPGGHFFPHQSRALVLGRLLEALDGSL
ncbi:MAG: alpha/beta fold hydrolase [Nannocystaceae bacterium]